MYVPYARGPSGHIRMHTVSVCFLCAYVYLGSGFHRGTLIPVQVHRFLLLSPFVYLPPCPTPFHTGTWTPMPGTVLPVDPAHLPWPRLPSRAPVCMDQSPLSSAPGSRRQASLEWEGQTF